MTVLDQMSPAQFQAWELLVRIDSLGVPWGSSSAAR